MDQYTERTELLWKAFNDADRLEQVLPFLPLAVGMIGFVLVLAMAMTMGRSHALRWTTVAVYAIGTAVAFALGSGASVGQDAVSERVGSQWPTWSWIPLAVPGVFLILSAVPQKAVRGACVVLALITAVFASGAVGTVISSFDEGLAIFGIEASSTTSDASDTPATQPAETGDVEAAGQPTGDDESDPASDDATGGDGGGDVDDPGDSGGGLFGDLIDGSGARIPGDDDGMAVE